MAIVMAAETAPAGEQVDAVVLAGGINRIPLFPGDRPGRKALVKLHGKPLIAYVLDALHECRSVGRVVVIGAREVLQYASQWSEVDGVPEGHTLIRNAHRGLVAARTDRVLFCNPDQPLLGPEMIDFFVDEAVKRDADMVSSWVRHESLGPYVEGEHKFFKFGDGPYAHGNLFLARRQFPNAAQVRARLDRLYGARKSNLKFAWELGPGLFGQFLISVLRRHVPSLEESLEIGGRHFGVKLASVICPHPEIVLDIDEPEDYAAAERHLALRQRDPGQPAFA